MSRGIQKSSFFPPQGACAPPDRLRPGRLPTLPIARTGPALEEMFKYSCSGCLQHSAERDAASRSPVFRSKGRPEEETGAMGAAQGNIMRVETTGASWQTAQGDRLGYSGVRASHKMAEMDSGRMENYRSIINAVGSNYNIEPALIAAIISRESRAGNVLRNGWDRGHRAFGLMQIDPRNSGLTPVGTWDSEAHLSQATDHLIKFIGVIGNKFPSWNSEQRLKGALAAYNMGERNVHSYENVDANTTGRDYSNDVVARAQWYKTDGGF